MIIEIGKNMIIKLIKSALVKLFSPVIQLFKTGKIDTDTIIASETNNKLGVNYIFAIDNKNVEKLVNLVKIQKDYVRLKLKSKN